MTVLDHIGVAVASLERRLALYRALGLEVASVEEVSSEKVRVAFLPVEGTSIELLEPTGPDSPVAAFIAKRGEGLHHLCFRVADIRGAMAQLKANGFELLTDEPARGAHGCLVCFVHPRSAGGVLVELSQPGG
ncbi:MAG: methylmalonyl-CoA epimerase [Thermoanaerobaculaceae bacterium]|nr:methylmalonyl-CoA epimerase [Thermoanaerobaculaceae bacterium]TAM51671.1 MAG: methylmalonyl-CoA epimerase [Acidobacteriota bacterium]